jgi:hypothetical protein
LPDEQRATVFPATSPRRDPIRPPPSTLLILLAIDLFSGAARADVHCRAIDGGDARLEQIDADRRIAFIRDELHEGAHKARLWSWSWTAAYGSIATYQLLSATVIDPSRDGRIDGYIGAASAAIGVATLQLMPLRVMADQRRLDRRLRLAPPGTDRCAILDEAEHLLLRDAASESFGAGPLVHAGNLAFNVGLAVLLGVGFNHWRTAGITAAVGTAVGEIEILSQPTSSVDALRRYRSGVLGGPTERPRLQWTLTPMLGTSTYGLQVAGSF